MISGLNQDFVVRLCVFVGVLLAMLAWESLSPRRIAEQAVWGRRGHNLALVALDTLLVIVIIRIPAVGAAELAATRDWGLFNIIELPGWLALIASILLLDLLIYGQHVVFHKVPLLWRIHRVHHTDEDMDVTTGIRFHPVEILLSMCIKIAFVVVLGAPVLAVMLFEIILSTAAMFNHANVYIDTRLDRYLRWLIVTPDMHRVHHSVIKDETDSNYGFNVPWWDRLFRTYRAQPQSGHLNMKLGQDEFQGAKAVHIGWLLVQPFLKAGQVNKK